MSKKHNPTKPCQPYQPRPVKVADKAGDDLAAFPAACHVLTGRQRDLPNPTAALANLGQPSERARLRAATVAHDQQQARARREALALLEREDARRDARAGIPSATVSEDLHAERRRPLDAPMATRVGAMPDPMAVLAWDAVIADAEKTVRLWWGKWSFTAALAVWSVACFLLGTVA